MDLSISIDTTDNRDRHAQIMAALAQLGETMSELSDAIGRLTTRVSEDFAHMRDLLDQALETETANEAEIARLTTEADALQDHIAEQVAALDAIDPDASYPAPRPPAEPEIVPSGDDTVVVDMSGAGGGTASGGYEAGAGTGDGGVPVPEPGQG